MTVELGGVLAGLGVLIAAVVTAIDARRRAKSAERTADKAMEASPLASLEGLRTEVRAVVDRYNDSTERWEKDRDKLEEERNRERARADAAEAVVLTLRAELAIMRIDQAATRAELADLRTRFETAIAANTAK